HAHPPGRGARRAVPNRLTLLRARAVAALAHPFLRRVAWYGRRVSTQFDRRFFISLAVGAFGFVFVAAVAITAVEKAWTAERLFDSVNWGVATVLGNGDPTY